MDKISYSVAAKALKGLIGKADIEGTSILLPVGNNADRPTLGINDRAMRVNTDIASLEWWDGTLWETIGTDITAVTIKGTDTEAAILTMVGVAGDVWVASDTLVGWLYTDSGWVSIGQLKGPQGAGISGIALVSTAGLVDTYEVTFTDSTTSTYNITNGKDGATWILGAVDPTTEGVDGDLYLNTTSYDTFHKVTGTWGPLGNIKGATGEGLAIKGSFASEVELPAAGTTGDGYIVGGYLYVWTGAVWENVGLIQGPQGIQGIQGPQGIQGNTGNGISSITRTSGDGSAGTVDVYTVLFTDATITTFTVSNGNDGSNGIDGLTIDHITRTSGDGSAGTSDTYTAYADVAEIVPLGSFQVYNGQDGIGAINDTSITTTTLWSSTKTNDEILAMAIALG